VAAEEKDARSGIVQVVAAVEVIIIFVVVIVAIAVVIAPGRRDGTLVDSIPRPVVRIPIVSIIVVVVVVVAGRRQSAQRTFLQQHPRRTFFGNDAQTDGRVGRAATVGSHQGRHGDGRCNCRRRYAAELGRLPQSDAGWLDGRVDSAIVLFCRVGWAQGSWEEDGVEDGKGKGKGKGAEMG